MNENRVCIVGAGPAGLTVGRALKRAGLAFDIIERHNGVGGIWDIENPGSPMYESAHFISSSGLSHFAGRPMPASYPAYPSHREVLRYIRDFAADAGLLPHVACSTSVERAERKPEGWRVTLEQAGARRTTNYSHLVCASGTTWRPKFPQFTGVFDGELIHSSAYRSPSRFAGRRVLIVGAGNSGCDIACDAATTAKATYISMRRGYHFVPKHLFGLPADQFASRSEWLPLWAQRPLFEGLLSLYHGDLTRLGLARPDHRFLESHPILNDQLLHHLRHGDVEPHRDVERLEGSTVVFVDGRKVEVDIIVCATGYRTETPYLAPGTIPQVGGRPNLFLNMFSREDERLFATGFLESNSGLFKLFDQKAHVLAYAIAASTSPEQHLRLRRLVTGPSPDTSGGVAYVDSSRHSNYVNIRAYRRELNRFTNRMGWPRFDPSALAMAVEEVPYPPSLTPAAS